MPLRPRARIAAALVAAAVAAACAAAAVAGVAACLTVPPPDVSTGADLRPQIWLADMTPQQGLLTEWPTQGFVVPIRVGSDGICEYSVYDLVGTSYLQGIAREPFPCPTSTLDGGIVTVTFSFPLDDPNACQDILFTVAHKFSVGQGAVPVTVADSNGGEQVRWQYRPSACFSYDAGPFADGAFPDSSSDAPLVVPEGGGGDP